MFRIGYHVSIAGTIDLAFDRAREVGCTAMQVCEGQASDHGDTNEKPRN